MRPGGRQNTTLAVVLVTAAACALPAFGKPPAPGPFVPPPEGTLSVCNTSGVRPVTGSFTYTLSALASAGGTLVLTIPVGTCASQVFYPQGAAVTVTETVPAGDAVASIALAGGASTVASSSLTAGSATVTIGLGQATLTFQTNAPLAHCVVPNVVGLTLTGATTSLRKHSCRVGVLHRVYSKAVRAGRVIGESPRRGSVLAHDAPVALVLSRGPRP